MITRNGKVARLPKQVRDALNGRLEDGEPGKQLVELARNAEALLQQQNADPCERWRKLQKFLKAVGQLRREDHQAARLLLDQARWEREALRLDQENSARGQKEPAARHGAPLGSLTRWSKSSVPASQAANSRRC